MSDFAKDPSFIYRKAYFDKLDNQISVISGHTIPIYDIADNTVTPPFIILSNTTLTPISTTSNYGYNATITLDIVTRFLTGGGKKLVDDIGNKIFEKIIIRDNFYQDSNWHIYTSSLDKSIYLESESTGGYTIRKLITFRNHIQQL